MLWSRQLWGKAISMGYRGGDDVDYKPVLVVKCVFILVRKSRALSTKSRRFTSSRISRPSRTSRMHRNSCLATDVITDVIHSMFSFSFSSCFSFLLRVTSSYHIINSSSLMLYYIPFHYSLSPAATVKLYLT